MSAEFFTQQQLFAFQIFHPPLIAGDKGFALALHNAIQKGFDLSVDPGQAHSDLRPHVFAFGSSALRQSVQFFDEALEGFGVRHYLCNESVEVLFKIAAANGFAIAGAAFLRAEVVWVLVAGLAGGPAGRERRFAVRADHEAAQREVRANILPGGCFRPGVQEFLDFLEDRERDQPFMLGFAEGDAPAGQFDISGIERLGQQVCYPLISDFTVR